MSDEKLRELERRWKETGAPEDEEAYLVERVRAGETLDWDGYSRLSELNVEAAAEYLRGRVERGELTQERLELAAYCLDSTKEADSQAIESWAAGLTNLGTSVCARACLVTAEFPNCVLASAEEPVLRTAIDLGWEWLQCPCEVHLGPALSASRECLTLADDCAENDLSRGNCQAQRFRALSAWAATSWLGWTRDSERREAASHAARTALASTIRHAAASIHAAASGDKELSVGWGASPERRKYLGDTLRFLRSRLGFWAAFSGAE